MLRKVTHCAGRVSANTRPHQLRWGDREMGTAISCTKCSQVAGLIQKLVETPRSLKVPSLRHVHHNGLSNNDHDIQLKAEHFFFREGGVV